MEFRPNLLAIPSSESFPNFCRRVILAPIFYFFCRTVVGHVWKLQPVRRVVTKYIELSIVIGAVAQIAKNVEPP